MNSEYKITLPPKTLDNADGKALALLEKAKAKLGFVKESLDQHSSPVAGVADLD